MIKIGNFFFKYRNLIFPIFGLSIFIPSPVLFPESVFGDSNFTIALVLGAVIAISGQVIRALTIALKYIVRGGKNKEVYAQDLVTEGLFNHCRNPLYVGNILMLLGVGLMSNSLYFMIIVVPLFCFIYQCIVLAEENFLRGKFGPQYDVYAKNVNRWIPNFSGLGTTLGSMQFNWRRYVVNEYNTVYLLLVSMLIVAVVYYPALANLPSNEKLQFFLTGFLLLSVIYLIIRYLKKSKKLKPNAA
jgi:protein-S-isoprenylcysteine O-methyltransferase Ste14